MFCLMFYGHESPSLPLLQPKPPTIGRYDYPEIENSYATRSRPVWGTEENLNKGYSDSEEDEYWKSMGYPLKRGRGRPPQHGRGRPLGFKTTSSGQLSGSGRGRGRGRGVRSGHSKLPKTPLFLGEAGRKAPDSIGGIPLTPGQKATWAATQANLRRGRMSKLEREKELEQRRKERLLKKQKGFKRRGRPPKKKTVKLDSSPEVKSPGEKSSEPKSPQPKSPEPESPLAKSPKPTSQEPTSQEPTSPGPRDSESDQNTDIDIEENNETTDSFLGVAPGSKIACQEPNDNKQDDEDTESQTTLMADSSASLSSLEQIGIRTSESDTEFVEVDEETGSGESDHSKTKKGTTAEARTKVVVNVSEKDCDTRFSSQTDQEIDNELRPGRKIVFKKKKTDSETDCEGRLESKELKQKDAKQEKNKKTSNLNKSSKPGSKKAKKFEDSNNSSDNPEMLEKQVSQDDEIKSLPENKELQEDMEVVESLDEQCANIVNTVEAEYQQSLKLKKTRMEKYLARKAEKKKKRSSRQNVLIHKTFKSSVPYVQHLDTSKPLTNLVSLDQVVVEDFHVKVLDQHNLPQKAEHDLHGLSDTSSIAQSSACTSALAQGPAAYQFSGIVRNSSDMDEMTTSESSTLISESDESPPSSSPSQQGTSGTGTGTQGEEAEEEEQQEKERYSDSDEEEEEEVYYGAFSSEDEAGDGDDDDDDYVPHSQLARHYSMPSRSRGRGRGTRGNRGRGSGSGSSWKSRGRNGQSQYGQQECSSSESLHVNSQGKSNKLGKMRKGIHNVSIVPDGARDRITASKVQPAGNKASVIPHDGKERVNYKDLMAAPFASFAGLPTMEQLFRTCGNREEICIEMMYKMTDRSNGADSGAEDDDGCQEGSGSGTEVEEQEEVYEVDENTGQLVLQQRTITKTSSHGLSNPTTVTQGSGQSIAPPSIIQHQRIVSDVAKDSDSEHLVTDDVNRSTLLASASWKTKQDIAFGAQSPRACGHSLFKLPSIPPSVQLGPRINNSKVSQKDSARGKELQPKHQKIFCCSLCSETFLNRSNLANHNRSRHASLSMTADQSIQCKLCGERPPDVDSTVRHMAEHAHGKLVCPACPVRCANIESLNSHIRKHDRVLGHQTDVNKNLVSTGTAK